MRPEAIAAHIAVRSLVAAGSAGLKSAHYPPPSSQPNTPSLIVWLRRSSIAHGSEQLWLMTVEGWLLTEEDVGLSKAVPVINNLITPLVDAFAVGTPGWEVAHDVDFCEVVNWEIPDAAMTWGGAQYYIAKLFWNVKLRRFPGDA